MADTLPTESPTTTTTTKGMTIMSINKFLVTVNDPKDGAWSTTSILIPLCNFYIETQNADFDVEEWRGTDDVARAQALAQQRYETLQKVLKAIRKEIVASGVEEWDVDFIGLLVEAGMEPITRTVRRRVRSVIEHVVECEIPYHVDESDIDGQLEVAASDWFYRNAEDAFDDFEYEIESVEFDNVDVTSSAD